ncbi:MAG: hypothetical protein ABI986_10265, partial [Chloroflexota bacterium]
LLSLASVSGVPDAPTDLETVRGGSAGLLLTRSEELVLLKGSAPGLWPLRFGQRWERVPPRSVWFFLSQQELVRQWHPYLISNIRFTIWLE